MPKIKTKKSLVKRIRKTKTGKMVHRSANISHLLEKRSTNRKRSNRKPKPLSKKNSSAINSHSR